MLYFDHNATSPLSAVARDAWLSASERFPGNPSSPHRIGSRAEVALSAARQQTAAHLGCSEFDLVWTSGATEGNNAIFHHCSQQAARDAEVWISAIEHPSVLAAAEMWFPGRTRFLKVTVAGQLDLDFLADQLKKSRPALIAVMAANNETGVLQPWPEALALCRKHEVPFACDTAQWVGKQPAAGLGQCDFVTGCAHKFGGPLGIGFLKIPKGFKPLIVGGPQEDGHRAGTENLPCAVAMLAAWTDREQTMRTDAAFTAKEVATVALRPLCPTPARSGPLTQRLAWRDQFIHDLQQSIPEIEIVGATAPRLWNTVAAIMPPTNDCRRRWVVQLDKLGAAVSTGSACSSGKEKPSHVLTAMGYEPSKSDRMLRFSSGWETTQSDWQQLLELITAAHDELSK